jgi:hypothetical protein
VEEVHLRAPLMFLADNMYQEGHSHTDARYIANEDSAHRWMKKTIVS